MATSTLLAILKFNDQFSSAYSKAIRNMDSGSKKVMTNMKRLSSIADNLGNVGRTMTAAVTLPIIGLGTKAVQSAVQYEGSIAKIMTLSGKLRQYGESEEQVRQTAIDTINDMSKAYGIVRTEVAQSYYELASAFNRTDDMARGMNTAMQLAIAGQTDAASAAKALARIYNVYDDESIEHIGDVLAKTQMWGYTTIPEMGEFVGKILSTAKQAGVGIEDLFSAIAVLTSNTGDTAESVTYLDNALKQVIKRGDRKELQKLGLIEYMEKIKKEAPEIEDVMDIFNNIRGAKGVIGLTSAIQLFKDYRSEIGKTDDALIGMTETQKNTSKYQFGLLKANWQTTLERIGEKILPEVNNALQILNEKLSNLSDEDIKKLIDAAKTAATIGPALIGLSTGLKVIAGLGKAVTIIKSLVGVLSGAKTAAAVTNATNLSSSVGTLGKVAETVSAGAGGALSTVAGGLAVGTIAAIVTDQYLKTEEGQAFIENTNKTGQYVPEGVEVRPNVRRANASQISRNATGTGNFSGGLTQVNEQGGELITLPEGSKILPANQTNKMMGGITINIPKLADQLVIRAEEDIDKIVNKLGDRLLKVYANY